MNKVTIAGINIPFTEDDAVEMFDKIEQEMQEIYELSLKAKQKNKEGET